MKKIGQRYQRTLQRTVEVAGIGFLTGAGIKARFRPAAADQGIIFVRTDLTGAPAIAASAPNVSETPRRTILGKAPIRVELVEHAMAALSGLQIDNCLVELTGPELPGLDGSAGAFVTALRDGGAALQCVRRDVWAATEPMTVSEGSATLTLYPGDRPGLRVSYLLDYGTTSPIGTQRFTTNVNPATFAADVAMARTFLLHSEAELLRKQGIGSKTSLQDLVVFGRRGPMENKLRWADEPARHKLLDVVGDLGLFGFDLAGHVVAYRSGHSLNVALVRKLLHAMPGRRDVTPYRMAA